MDLFTADTHFGHYNIIKHDGRPFTSADEMDEYLITNWNSRVKDNDDVWVVGDFCYRNAKPAHEYIKELKGKIHLIIGNHDTKLLKDDEAIKRLVSIDSYIDTVINKQRIIMCHYPIVEWNGYFRQSWHIYAHIHNNKNNAFNVMIKEEKALNAGCMINNYIPVTFDELIQNNKIYREINGITV